MFLLQGNMQRETVESVQDFLIKLDMKPCMHLVEISIFFTKSCHRQTYQNYEQSQQKLDTCSENKVVPQKSKFSKKILKKLKS